MLFLDYLFHFDGEVLGVDVETLKEVEDYALLAFGKKCGLFGVEHEAAIWGTEGVVETFFGQLLAFGEDWFLVFELDVFDGVGHWKV